MKVARTILGILIGASPIIFLLLIPLYEDWFWRLDRAFTVFAGKWVVTLTVLFFCVIVTITTCLGLFLCSLYGEQANKLGSKR